MLHRQEVRASQRRFLCHVRDLIDVIRINDNPFEEGLRGLVPWAIKSLNFPYKQHSVYFIESTGKEQFKTY